MSCACRLDQDDLVWSVCLTTYLVVGAGALDGVAFVRHGGQNRKLVSWRLKSGSGSVAPTVEWLSLSWWASEEGRGEGERGCEHGSRGLALFKVGSGLCAVSCALVCHGVWPPAQLSLPKVNAAACHICSQVQWPVMSQPRKLMTSPKQKYKNQAAANTQPSVSMWLWHAWDFQSTSSWTGPAVKAPGTQHFKVPELQDKPAAPRMRVAWVPCMFVPRQRCDTSDVNLVLPDIWSMSL